MKKFNGFENWFIHTAINAAVEKAEQDILDAEKKGERLIYASGYFTMVGEELKSKVDTLTLKKDLQK